MLVDYLKKAASLYYLLCNTEVCYLAYRYKDKLKKFPKLWIDNELNIMSYFSDYNSIICIFVCITIFVRLYMILNIQNGAVYRSNNVVNNNVWIDSTGVLQSYNTRGGSRVVGRGVSVSRSHMSFYLQTGGGRHMDRSTYIMVNISQLLILQFLH